MTDAEHDEQPDAAVDDLLRRWVDRGHDTDAAWAELDSDDPRVLGPTVRELTARLSTVPGWFLTDPLGVRALTGDVIGDGSTNAEAMSVAGQIDSIALEAPRILAGLALWLWASEDVVGRYSRPLRRDLAGRTLAALAFRLAASGDPREFVTRGPRRDELARTFLLWSGQRPADEDTEAARSLLDACDSLQHNQLLAEALATQEHRLAVAQQLAAARAREAAARYSPE